MKKFIFIYKPNLFNREKIIKTKNSFCQAIFLIFIKNCGIIYLFIILRIKIWQEIEI